MRDLVECFLLGMLTVSDAEREHLLAPSSCEIVSLGSCLMLYILEAFHTADGVHVTATDTASLDLNIDIYTQSVPGQSQ
jgi:hypothetical protein